jgi:hypothetical protein
MLELNNQLPFTKREYGSPGRGRTGGRVRHVHKSACGVVRVQAAGRPTSAHASTIMAEIGFIVLPGRHAAPQ